MYVRITKTIYGKTAHSELAEDFETAISQAEAMAVDGLNEEIIIETYDLLTIWAAAEQGYKLTKVNDGAFFHFKNPYESCFENPCWDETTTEVITPDGIEEAYEL